MGILWVAAIVGAPRHDSADTIRRAVNLGVCVKMITGTGPFSLV